MRAWLAPFALAASLTACSAPDEAASRTVIGQFHAAIDASDWAAVDALLTRSTRDLRPGGATARAFRALTARHGRYLGGDIASITAGDGHTRILWQARYEKGPVRELFVLVEEGGGLKVDSYSDQG
ncbi:MAG: hypothetical protein RIS17_1244 [Pseudomonadota bacterium]